MSIQFKIMQTRDDGLLAYNLEPIINAGTRVALTAISIPFITNNHVVSRFDSLSTDLNNVNISNNQFLQPSNTLYRILYESKEEQTTVNSTNPITLMNSYDVGTATTPYANETAGVLRTINGGAPVLPAAAPNGLITPRMQYALKQQCNFNNCQSNYLNSQIPSPLFLSDDPIHFGAGVKLI
jgi:hypothetical protein